MALAIVVQRAPGDVEDSELIRRIADGDRAAFEQIYLRYHRRLSRFLMRFSSDYSVAEEVINDTLHVVWNKAREFRGDSQVSTWIIGIAYRRALKAFKRLATRREAEVSETLESHGEALTSGDASQERADWLAQGLAQLPIEQRMVIEMAYFFGQSCEEIAQVMGCPVNTVKTRMFHARRRLRELLPRLAEPTAPAARLPS